MGIPKQYTVTETEKILNVTKPTMYKYIYSGQIKATKIGGTYRISEDEVNRFLTQGTDEHYSELCKQNNNKINRDCLYNISEKKRAGNISE